MDFSKLTQKQLSQDTEIKPFKCAEDDLNGFLFDDAKHFQKELMAVTYLLEDRQMNYTVAYSAYWPIKFHLTRMKGLYGTN